MHNLVEMIELKNHLGLLRAIPSEFTSKPKKGHPLLMILSKLQRLKGIRNEN